MDDTPGLAGLKAEQRTIPLTTAAHRVLFGYDLLWEILRFLDSTCADPLGENKPALAALARVCKPLSSMALDVLWRHLDIPAAFLQLLTSNRSLGKSSPMGKNIYIYSKRVRSLETIPSLSLSDIILMIEQSVFPFPNLTNLSWVISTSTTLIHLPAFVTPCLEQLSIINEAAVSDNFAFFPRILIMIHDRAPGLSSLFISWNDARAPSPDFSSNILYGITLFVHLTELRISYTVVAAPHMIDTLSRLRHLRIFSVWHDREVDYQTYSFSAVQSGNVIHKFGHFTSDLVLDFPGDAEQFFGESYNPLSISIIPRLQSTHLVNIKLSWLDSSQVTNALCHDMSLAWPHLRDINLVSVKPIRHPPPSMVTLEGLWWFAINCPDLLSMTIQVNGSGDHWGHGNTQTKFPTVAVKLSELNLTTSLITSPPHAAAYLRWCFPALRILKFHDTVARMCGQEERITAWNDLRALISS